MIRLSGVKDAFGDLAELLNEQHRNNVRKHLGSEQIWYDVRSSLLDIVVIPIVWVVTIPLAIVSFLAKGLLFVAEGLIEMTSMPLRARYLKRSRWKLAKLKRTGEYEE